MTFDRDAKCYIFEERGLSFVALIILGSRLHQVDKEAGFLQVILNTWFRESVPHPMAVAASLANDSQTRGSGAAAAQRGRSPPMLSERAQRTLLAFREDVRYFYRELDAARMTLILSIVFVGIFILSWWWMAFAIKQARSDGGVSLRTVLLLAVFAAVDVAASTGFILLRIIMYIRKDHLFPQEMRKPIPSLEYDQLAAYAALRLFTIQSSCGSIDILVIIVVGFLTGLRVYSVVCVFSYYKKAKNGNMDLFGHKNVTGDSDTSSRIDRLKIMEDYGPKSLMGKYSKRNGFGSFPNRSGDRSRIGSVTGSVFEEEPPELKIQAADMPIEMQRSAVFSATQAIKLYSTEKHIAESIKQDFDQMYHPTWHCIVGRNWGSCVTHSKQCYIRLAYKDLTILLYRST
ncbi:dynein light chain 1, cytoplasmic [Trichonephila inaurata madagascariensis]|uniref:Dynein light chain 1, cytoplasmic n=1 Tax=Trichonephila inaurata madagascariensis TaxID=2747483 RepID=A0A8X6IGP4_9ARAC|nr:dynein light chain 1, cytoplasmic [Trichonephila inaurata madagascariensis]